MKPVEGEVYCEDHGCIHDATSDPYQYGPDEDHPDAVYCKPHDWRRLWAGAYMERYND